MAKKDKSTEERIHDAAKVGRIVMAESTNIDDYEEIAREFLKTIYDINYDECFISDESALSDFAGCGMPKEMYFAGINLTEYYKIGRKYTVTKILETYGIDVNESEYLVKVFEQIRQSKYKLVN